MKILRGFALGFGVVLFALTAGEVAHASTQDFTIKAFEGDYFLTRGEDGVAGLRVSEKIIAEFPDFDQNHGILRAIPDSYDDHSLEINMGTVTDETGKDYTYDTYTDNGNKVLKIGDADAYVHGQKTYFIDYKLRGVIKDFGDHQELYWDINGDQWQQTFDSVQATVVLEGGLERQLLGERACFVGGYGSKTTCNMSSLADNRLLFTSNSQLYANRTMTVVLSFKPGTFAAYKPSPALIRQQIIQALGFVVPPLLALGVAIIGWRRHGRDDKGKGVIVPQYLPPKDVTVLESNLVLREHFETRAISATVIDLAVRHYLKVYEIKQEKLLKDKIDYELELVKEPTGLTEHERSVLAMLFPGGLTVGSRSALKDMQSKLYAEAAKLGKKIEAKVTSDGYFRIAPTKAQIPYQTVATILFIVSFFFMPWTLGVLGAAVILFIASFSMPARTLKGVELREYLLGLKQYMQLAEADRLNALQSPRGDLTEKIDVNDKQQLVKLYERLLPYAMLFGIEKEWAKQFASLYDEQPDWYVGSSAFNAVYFASAVSAFGTSTTTSFSPPSGSGSSGFSGGAGGGGGGGGGGGW